MIKEDVNNFNDDTPPDGMESDNIMSIDDELILEQEFEENISCEDSGTEDSLGSSDEDMNAIFNFQTNKHKREGKHSLKRDIIFNGKLNKEVKDIYDGEEIQGNQVYKIEVGSSFEFESKNHEEYVNQKQLSKDVFDTLTENTTIDFSTNRRKPNRMVFNGYYTLLLEKLRLKYTHSEIFVELAYYFTDNIFNMFKLLDKKYATTIIKELKAKGYLKDLNDINFI